MDSKGIHALMNKSNIQKKILPQAVKTFDELLILSDTPVR
jgi:hypothetical protein